MTALDISVIIPAYNAAGTLPAVLNALQAQDLDRRQFEVLVVDDGSTDATPDRLKAFAAGTKLNFSWWRRDRSRSFGPAAARNEALARAAGRVIAFTDADCVPDPDWLRTIRRSVIDEKWAIVGGEVRTDDFQIFPWKVAPAGHVGVTANLACDAAKLGRLRFSEDFRGAGCEDADLIMAAKKMGFPLHYEPRMKVLHPVNTVTVRAALRRAFWRGENDVMLRRRHDPRELDPKKMSWLTRPLLFGRVSPLALAAAALLLAAIMLLGRPALLGAFAAILLVGGSAVLLLGFYRLYPIPAADRHRVTWQDKLKTLFLAWTYVSVLLCGRIAGSVKYRYLII